MTAARLRPVVRVVTLIVATAAFSLSGGAPSWTDSMQPRGDKAQERLAELADQRLADRADERHADRADRSTR